MNELPPLKTTLQTPAESTLQTPAESTLQTPAESTLQTTAESTLQPILQSTLLASSKLLSPQHTSKIKPLESFYKNKTVVVTGASSGIGQSASILLAALGANVLILSRTQVDLENTLKMLNEVKLNDSQVFSAYTADLRDTKALFHAVEKILKDFSVDILVNNAGVYYTNYFHKQTPEQIESMVLTNMMAPLLLSRAVIPHFLSRGGGQIINVSSLAAKLNFTGYGVYGGTKAGLTHSSKGLQFEYGPKNIYFSDFFAPDSLTRGYQEELKTMPEETKNINGTVKAMRPLDVALSMLVGASKRQLEIVPGVKSQTISFLAKHLPVAAIQGILRILSK